VIPSSLAAEPLASTTTAIATTATTATSTTRTDRTTRGVEGAMIATTTAIAAGCRTRGVGAPSDRRCEMRSSPHASKLQQTSPGTTGRPT
jgi:hypothetical protein